MYASDHFYNPIYLTHSTPCPIRLAYLYVRRRIYHSSKDFREFQAVLREDHQVYTVQSKSASVRFLSRLNGSEWRLGNTK